MDGIDCSHPCPPNGSTCFDLQPWKSKTAGLTPEYAIHCQILKDTPFLHVLSGTAFVGHAKFLHHPSRSRIARHMCGIDAVQPEHLEAISHHRLRSFRTVALPPEGDPEPIAQFGTRMRRLEA